MNTFNNLTGGGVDTKDIMVLGLGIQEPWRLVGQHLDTTKKPKELQLEIQDGPLT
jgi:hypothetical protein